MAKLSLESLELVDAIARRGSFASAAEELGRVPSAVTYAARRLEQEGVRARRECAQGAVLRVVDTCVLGDFREIPAHQGEVVVRLDAADAADALKRVLVAHLAAQGIAGVGGIDDDAAVLDDLYRLTDQSGLYGIRLTLTAPDDHVVLPEIISKEPLGPAVRQGDDQWFDIVSWTHYALVTAEEFGITQANVDEIKSTTTNPDIKRFLGAEADTKIGTDLGLTNDWAYNIIKGVGNYGEVFERNLGKSTPLEIDRGLNALWNNGGIQYAPPVR